jgi:hypothetical protein
VSAAPLALLSRPLLCVLLKQLVRRVTKSAAEDVGEQPMLLLSPTELLDQQRPGSRRAGLLLSIALLPLGVNIGGSGGGGVRQNAPVLLLRAKQLVLLLLLASSASLLAKSGKLRRGSDARLALPDCTATAAVAASFAQQPASAFDAAVSSGASSALQQQHLGASALAE